MTNSPITSRTRDSLPDCDWVLVVVTLAVYPAAPHLVTVALLSVGLEQEPALGVGYLSWVSAMDWFVMSIKGSQAMEVSLAAPTVLSTGFSSISHFPPLHSNLRRAAP